MSNKNYFDSSFVFDLVRVATGQLGTLEVGVNGGDAVRAYQSATWLSPASWAWCAAFVCWCFRSAAVGHEIPPHAFPETPRAFGFEEWGNDYATLIIAPHEVFVGDIVIFSFSHVAIAVENSRVAGECVTIDGNAGNANGADGVFVHRRSMHLVRSVVRLSVI